MKRKKWIRGIVALTVLAASLFAAFYNGLTVSEYTVKTGKLKEPLKAVLLTDLHSCFYGENQEQLIAVIDKQNPDIILMSGDIADDKIPNDGAAALLEGIARKYPCFYVSGNHEVWSNDFKMFREILLEYGVSILEGDMETIEINGQKVNICGVSDPEIGKAKYTIQLDRVFEQLDDEIFTIFLAHRPERIYQYPSDCLIVSGHAHGGQWRIPFFVNGLYAPNQGWFPEYAGGLYEVDGKTMVVGRGLSRESTRIPRVFNPPEVVVINIAVDGNIN